MTNYLYKIFKINFRIVLAFFIVSFSGLICSAQFIENKGQLDSKVIYSKAINSGNLLISEQGFSYLFYDNSKFQELYEKFHLQKETKTGLFKNSKEKPLIIKYHSIEQQFVGGNIKKTRIIPSKAEFQYYNYFLGNDKSKWASGVKAYNTLLVQDLYPGIDLELVSNGLELKYNFICRPGSNPSQIKMRYKGADKIVLNSNILTIKTSIIEYAETIPSSYLIHNTNPSGGQLEEVLVTMKLEDNIVSFTNAPVKQVNSGSTLVIDPKLVFSTYSGTTADNFGFTATYDSLGNMYAGGITTSPYQQIPGGKFPATAGAFSETYNGGVDEDGDYSFPCDITVSKYSSDGKNLIYATYIGGSSNEYPHSIVVDNQDNLIIIGSTFSLNYPTTFNSYSPLKSGGSDIIVTKLNSKGTNLIGSTYYGGSENDGLNESSFTKYFYADNFRGDVITDKDGSILGVIATNSDDIEIKDGFKTTKTNKIQQGLIFKFSPDLSQLVWSSYVGGQFDAMVYSIDFDKNKNIFVSGGIAGGGLTNTSGTVNPGPLGGKTDGFIATISANGKTLIRATYFGSNQYDQIISLELDNNDRVYIVGQTEGAIPIKGNVYNNPNSGQFIAMLDHELTTILLSTTFGTGDGKPDITINAFMVEQCRRVFISGWGGGSSTKFFSNTTGLPITKDAFQPNTDGSDFYIIVFDKELKKLVYATFFGGNITNDHVDGGTSRFDKKGIIYQSVCSSCPAPPQKGPLSDFPVTKGAYAEKNISPRCSNAAFKFALENLNTEPQLKDTFFEMTAFDTLNFDYSISDPDEDTITTQFNCDNTLKTQFATFPNPGLGIGKSVSSFSWSPTCVHVGKDTFRIIVDVQDRGCPEFKTNTGLIKIKVNPPPVLPPPETVCLFFKSNDHLNISWSDLAASKYFLYTVLYKVFPDGKIVPLDTFRTLKGGNYLDKNVVDPRNRNYGYYLKVFNRCKVWGVESTRLSSVAENESPVPATQVVNATVVQNKDVSIHWLPSKEPNFGSYSVYRSVNSPTLKFEYITSLDKLNDTFFVDKTVNVQTQSFCYSLVVNDRCGRSSIKSNIGCNIILSGESKPFYHNLDWQPYRLWEAGVVQYTLERSVDTGTLRTLVSVDANQLKYSDRELDYDWGGYWYSVVAHESFKGLSSTSRSNSIYLIQPPLLHVPNAFTKNGDQLNETWGFVPVFVKTYHMQVFNRWGQKIFDSEDKKQDWDGNFLEETKGIEVFAWQVTYTGWDRSSHYKKGTVTVIK